MRELALVTLKLTFPSTTIRGRFVRSAAAKFRFLQPSSGADAYDEYIRSVESVAFFDPVDTIKSDEGPVFSIIVPFFNTPDKYLQPLIDSVTNQSFRSWELIMADASTDPRRVRAIRESSALDPRFKYVKLSGNAGISANTNAALPHAVGEYVVFMDHDDTLSVHALNEVAIAINESDGVDILYSDEDVLSDDGRRRSGPFFKPSWSPHMFLEMNYTNHLSVIRRTLVEEVGGFRPEVDGAQDYDLLLRLHALVGNLTVKHIPKVLYHWRQADHSTARSMAHKSYALDAGKQSLEDYFRTLGITCVGVSDVANRPGWYSPHVRAKKSVRVITQVSSDPRVNEHFAQLLRRATKEEWASATFVSLPITQDLETYCHEIEDDIVVIVRYMYLPQQPSWLDEIVGVMQLPDTAGVAPLLMDRSDGRVVNAGFVDVSGCLQPLYSNCIVQQSGQAGPADLIRDVEGLLPHVIAFPRTTAHAAFFRNDTIDGRDWDDRLVLWSHVRFSNHHMPYQDTTLNDNLFIQDSTVVLTESA